MKTKVVSIFALMFPLPKNQSRNPLVRLLLSSIRLLYIAIGLLTDICAPFWVLLAFAGVSIGVLPIPYALCSFYLFSSVVFLYCYFVFRRCLKRNVLLIDCIFYMLSIILAVGTLTFYFALPDAFSFPWLNSREWAPGGNSE